MKKENIEYLKLGLDNLSLTYNDEKIAIIEDFYNDLIEFNTHTNLTRILDEKDFIDKHFFDSLSALKVLDENKNLKIIDIGTGAGFPLMPLLIFYPEIEATFVDSVNKKLDFIRNFSEKLVSKYNFKKENIKIVHSRAEDLAKDKNFREKYDVVISRAVSKLASLTELNMPFIKKQGSFIAMKSYDCDEELKEAEKIIKLIGGEFDKCLKFDLIGNEIKRALIVIKKLNTTPNIFPRKSGFAQKDPII